MITGLKYNLAISTVYLWIGFVCAISFMEAWLKFSAPGVTLPIGLSIGRIVFNALNKAEWVFALAIIFNLWIVGETFFSRANFSFFLPLVLLIIQTVYLLPALDQRAIFQIQQTTVTTSYLHFYYVAIEIVKVISLFIFSIKLFK
ncbi:MAG: hypothetical protein ABI207_09190 [Crocinitomicaceae bacterium]